MCPNQEKNMPRPIRFPGNELHGFIDIEQKNIITGWICGDFDIDYIFMITRNGHRRIALTYGAEREDVQKAFPLCANSLNSGFYAHIPQQYTYIDDKISFEVTLKNGGMILSEVIQLDFIKQLEHIESMEKFHHEDVPLAENISHCKWTDLLVQKFNKKGVNVLEVGSRIVTGACFRGCFSDANYIGFDFYEGKNVDVVGDAHKLSTYFPTQKFDLIFSTAVFEHLAMPWIVSREIVKLLNQGGYVFIETHYSFSSHERPWHFFQYSENALKVLFNPAMGIECVEAGVSNPICGFFSGTAATYLKHRFVTGMYGHSGFYGKKVKEVAGFDWNNCELSEIVNNTVYPTPKDSPSI
jgi:hypothetical protein